MHDGTGAAAGARAKAPLTDGQRRLRAHEAPLADSRLEHHRHLVKREGGGSGRARVRRRASGALAGTRRCRGVAPLVAAPHRRTSLPPAHSPARRSSRSHPSSRCPQTRPGQWCWSPAARRRRWARLHTGRKIPGWRPQSEQRGAGWGAQVRRGAAAGSPQAAQRSTGAPNSQCCRLYLGEDVDDSLGGAQRAGQRQAQCDRGVELAARQVGRGKHEHCV